MIVRTSLRGVVPTTFNCPICNHEKSVECKMERNRGMGYIHCNICGVNFQASINFLSEAVDVYTEWLDEKFRSGNAETPAEEE